MRLATILIGALAERDVADVDLTHARVLGVPANFMTAARYPCHDRDLMRDALASIAWNQNEGPT